MVANIWLALVFLVLALVSYVMSVRGIAGFSMEIGKWLVIIFAVLGVIVVLFGAPGVLAPGVSSPTPAPATINVTGTVLEKHIAYGTTPDYPACQLVVSGLSEPLYISPRGSVAGVEYKYPFWASMVQEGRNYTFVVERVRDGRLVVDFVEEL